MKRLIILLSTCTLIFGGFFNNHNRIINGIETTIEEHPYQVSLQVNGSHNCGGSIINKDTILTAAHCVNGFDYNLITIRVGSTFKTKGDKYKYTIAKIFEHEEYFIGAGANNDIAIIKLTRPLIFTNQVQPIELQPAGNLVPPGTVAVVSGWGNINATHPTRPNDLRAVEMDIISNEECQRKYENKEIITWSMLCALTPNQGACFGDSGGPLVANGRLVGVVSWGYGCGDGFYPTVYANVSALHGFIDKFLYIAINNVHT